MKQKPFPWRRKGSKKRHVIREQVAQEEGRHCIVCNTGWRLDVIEHPRVGPFLMCDLCEKHFRFIIDWYAISTRERVIEATLQVHGKSPIV